MRSIMRHVRHTAWAMAFGAGLAYLLDPDQGAERRRRLVELGNGLTGDRTGGSGEGGMSESLAGSSRRDGDLPPDASTAGSPPLVTPPAAVGPA